MNEIKSFTFFEDYYNLISTLPIDEYKELSIAILDYMFKDIKPNLEGHLLAIFNTLSHQLNASKKQSKIRTKQEPNKNQKGTKQEPNENQKETKQEPKGNQTKTNNNISTFYFLISNFKFNNNLEDKIKEWIKYKSERKEYYKETGFNTLLARIDSATSQYGVDAVINLINECMANNYKGIIFEKLRKQQNKSTKRDEELEKWLNE